MPTVVAEIRNMEGRLYRLFRGRMELVPEKPDAGFYRATRGQVKKVFKAIKKFQASRRYYETFRYSFINPNEPKPSRDRGYARASKTTVTLGCQTFTGKNAATLRQWAVAN